MKLKLIVADWWSCKLCITKCNILITEVIWGKTVRDWHTWMIEMLHLESSAVLSMIMILMSEYFKITTLSIIPIFFIYSLPPSLIFSFYITEIKIILININLTLIISILVKYLYFLIF